MRNTTEVEEEVLTLRCGHVVNNPFMTIADEEERWDKINEWREGALLQNVLPHVATADREVLISGTCQTCWDKMFGGEE